MPNLYPNLSTSKIDIIDSSSPEMITYIHEI